MLKLSPTPLHVQLKAELTLLCRNLYCCSAGGGLKRALFVRKVQFVQDMRQLKYDASKPCVPLGHQLKQALHGMSVMDMSKGIT